MESSEIESPIFVEKSILNPSRVKKKTSKKKKKTNHQQWRSSSSSSEDETEGNFETKGWNGKAWESAWPRRCGSTAGGGVMLEGYVEAPAPADGANAGSDGAGGIVVGRTKSLTDDDLEELKGCLDLGFGFSYDEIPELCNTLPALELCYSMSRSLEAAEQPSPAAGSPPIANWKISSPGDDPEEVKARLKYWAQAVACTVKLCS